MQVWSLGWEDLLEKEMAKEEPGRLQSMGWQRVRHNWATHTHLYGVGNMCYCLPIQVLISSRNTLIDISGKMFSQLSRHLVSHSSWHIKLNIRLQTLWGNSQTNPECTVFYKMTLLDCSKSQCHAEIQVKPSRKHRLPLVRVAIIKESTRTYLVVKGLRLWLPMQGTWFRSREKHNLKRYMHPNVQCSTVYNSQDVEAT